MTIRPNSPTQYNDQLQNPKMWQKLWAPLSLSFGICFACGPHIECRLLSGKRPVAFPVDYRLYKVIEPNGPSLSPAHHEWLLSGKWVAVGGWGDKSTMSLLRALLKSPRVYQIEVPSIIGNWHVFRVILLGQL